jgi:nicotinate phosphoribosyltransferase
MEQIINSILDTDLYKLTQQWAVMQKFPDQKVRYSFINRNKTKFSKVFVERLKKQIKLMESISLTEDEAKYLTSIRFLPNLFIDFLKGYRFNSNNIKIDYSNEELSITIEGY